MSRNHCEINVSRRGFLAGAATIACTASSIAAQDRLSTPADPDCPRCGGAGRVPLVDAKPFVWVTGTPRPTGHAAIGEQFCPVCQSDEDAAALAVEAKAQLESALEKNKQWEDRMQGKLTCVVTRHATVHTQLTPAQARQVGLALESLTLHLKRLTGSMLLAATRPDTLELMLLWEQPAWDEFRKVMEGLYTLEQLGESWPSARLYNAYDHVSTPHMYETPQSVRSRPPSCGAVVTCSTSRQIRSYE